MTEFDVDLAQAAPGPRRGRMKPDADFAAAQDPTLTAAGRELRAIVERLERLAEERAAVGEEIKAEMAEAKARGYDTRTLRAVLKRRKLHPDDVAEAEALLDLYLSALGAPR